MSKSKEASKEIEEERGILIYTKVRKRTMKFVLFVRSSTFSSSSHRPWPWPRIDKFRAVNNDNYVQASSAADRDYQLEDDLLQDYDHTSRMKFSR